MKLLKKEEIIKGSSPLEKNPTAGIYFLIYKENIVYVGISKESCNLRIQTHKKDNKKFDRYFIIVCENSEERELLEAEYIFKFSPKYNKGISKIPKYSSIELIGNISHPTPSIENFQIKFSVIGNRVYAKIRKKREND